ncbi:hypothetical protein BDW59DRAFT_158521 [Aspergillus cavernicola]|uniref:F-box domain-containing protein n=1 Tax=Aspergillus cavernicola TaxID=176166 RepID=A0ABR4IS86_9EURO
MLGQLPVEILLQITGYLDNETLTNLYQLCCRLYHVIGPRLREIYRTKTVDLGAIKRDQELDIRPHLTDRRTLKFVEELIFQDYSGDLYTGIYCSHHVKGRGKDLGLALMPLFRGLKRNSLVSFSWNLRACIPHQILGPRGYLRRHQRNIERVSLKTGWCPGDTDPSGKLSISRFHRLRSLSWTGISTINHCIALTELFAVNAHCLEELELGLNSLPQRLAKWRDLQKDWMKARNAFAFKILQLQQNQSQAVFPWLRKLSLYGVDFRYAFTEMAYAFQLHKLQALKFRRCYFSSDVLRTIAEIADNDTIQLASLDIKLNPYSNRDLDSFQRFFALSMPNLEDVFIHVEAYDQTSLKTHLRSIFALGRNLKRFVYHSHLDVEGDLAGAWEPTEAPMVWDDEILTLLSNANLQCFGLCDQLPSLRFHLSQHSPMTWEILHVRSLPTMHLEYQPHNPGTFHLDFDFDAPFTPPPNSLFDPAPYRPNFTAAEITDLLAFASWAFGPRGLPKLDLLVLGEVDTVRCLGPSGSYSICLTRNTDVSTRIQFPYRQVMPGDEEIRREFQAHEDFFKTG